MDNKKKLELLTDLFETEEGEITPETHLEDIESWDSMMKLSLIVMMDDECGKKLSANDIKAFQTVQDIMNYMN